jgi:murein DD-endopeptidase MepM/ murein hydrolase activator NlpD
LNRFGSKPGSDKRLKRYAIVLSIPFMILVLSYFIYKLFMVPSPIILGVEQFLFLPKEKTILIHGENFTALEVDIVQGIKMINLISDSHEDMDKSYELAIKPRELGLNDGPATVMVKAKSGILKRESYEIDSLIDTIPPSLQVIKAPTFIQQGSGGFALLRISGADAAYVQFDDHKFKAFRSEHAVKEESSPYMSFFPAPFDAKGDTIFYAVAEDRVGNRVLRALPSKVKKGRFRSSSITIGDDFVNRVVLPLLNSTDLSDPVSAFKQINEEWRVTDTRKLEEISREAEPMKLWDGVFLQVRNSKVMAPFGDQRTYFYKNVPISESVHLGYDLASVSHAPVGAANSGIVKFAGTLGIYGNTVIVDHGLGLMSLYGHLSEIRVMEGQQVKKGETIANTGSTGFAGGDHLHFGILIHGIEVSPLHWWDRRWLQTNVLQFLEPQVSPK